MKQFKFKVTTTDEQVTMSKKHYGKLVEHVTNLEKLAAAAIALHELNQRRQSRGYLNVVDEIATVQLFDDYIKAVETLLD